MCINIEKRFEIKFSEIGSDENHVHFLVQSVPMLSVKQIVQTVKSVRAKEIFRLHPEVKQQLWGGQFWSSGYYVNTVGQYANEETIKKYISTLQNATTQNVKRGNQNTHCVPFQKTIFPLVFILCFDYAQHKLVQHDKLKMLVLPT